jgi:hypothetical protein
MSFIRQFVGGGETARANGFSMTWRLASQRIVDDHFKERHREVVSPQETKSCGVPFSVPWADRAGISPRRKPVPNKTKPAFEAFLIEGEGDSAFWTRIGAAWAHEDKKGFNLQLAAIPLSGRVALRIPKPREKRAAEPKSSDKK